MTETTDNIRARVFYDHHCPVCRASLARWRNTFEKRGIEFAPLQSPWVREKLGLAPGELPEEMKLLTRDGRTLGGPRALAWMCRRVWWLSLPGVIMDLPLVRWLTRQGYRWVARNRYCLGDVCELRTAPAHHERHHAATTFLEIP